MKLRQAIKICRKVNICSPFFYNPRHKTVNKALDYVITVANRHNLMSGHIIFRLIHKKLMDKLN